MRRYVLVAGVDYEFKGVNFRIFCDSRMKRLIAANRAKEDLTFVTLDFRSGQIVTRTVTYPGGTKVESVSTDSTRSAVTRANYGPSGRFRDGQSGLLSVLDVYETVRAVGADDPGTLHELSFFAHAWMGGPILVNSYDDGSYQVLGYTVPLPAAMRDPDDMDPRAKDFGPPTMRAGELAEFRAAFHADALVWIWGCAFPRVVHEILHKLEHHRDYRPTGLADARVFVFTNFRADHVSYLAAMLGTSFPDPRRVELTFGQLRSFFCRVSRAGYSQLIADASERRTFAGLMGTYSVYDKGPLPLMTIDPSFGRHITFYKNYLGFRTDPESRRYGEYLPGSTCP